MLGGALQENGMVSFKKDLTTQDTDAIRAYLVSTANQAKNAPPAPAFGPGGPGGPPPAPAAPAAAPAATPAPALHQ